jgi:signal transduction histidine kinase/ligand-binding sensor domain-containing protein
VLRFTEGKLTRYTVEDGLVSNDAQAIYEDREGSIWVGSAGGLNRLTNRLITNYSDADGLAANNIYPLYQDRQGSIWIGSWRGLSVYKDGAFTPVSERYGVSNNMIMSLLEDRAGNFWIGTWGDGVKQIRDGKITQYLPRDGIPLRIMRVIYEDSAGNIWFGSNTGLARYDGNTFTLFTTKDGLSGNTIYAIFEDSRGNLWFGTEAGLTRYSNGMLSSYTEKDGLSGNNVRAIYEDAEGVLWVGTYDAGINRLKDDKFARLTTREGLFDNGAFHIIEDAHGYFWISCNRGVYRVSRKNLNELADGKTARIISVSYGKGDGGLNVECNGGGQPAGLKASDGKFWFPTQNGILVIAPEAVPVNTPPPPVVIDEFVVGREKVAFNNGVEISHEQESFEIHYVGLSFIKPDQVRFKYKLEGLEADWVDADTRRVAYYTHLPPGRYKFMVVAANTNGVWSTDGATVEIVVVPPFWRTWWFITLIVAGLLAVAISLYRQRIGRLKLAHAAREAFSQKLIESQEKERKRIAAELHDSIGQDLVIIRNWALLGLNVVAESDPSAKQLTEISNTASKAINEVREIAYNLAPYQLDRLGLTRTIEDMVERVSAASNISFATDIEQLDGKLSKEGEINLYRVIQEAVSNTIKHSGASKADLTIRLATNHLLVTLRDNGRGFIAEGADTYNPRQSGFGLVGSAERIRILGGTWSIHSAFGDGTQIIIQLPLRTKNDNGREIHNGKRIENRDC